MCYYLGKKVTRAEYNRLKAVDDLRKRIAFLNEEIAIFKGFDYNMMNVIKPIGGTHETEIVEMQWGFIPNWVKSWEDLKKFRNGYKNEKTGKWIKGYNGLNATSEELLNKMFAEAALTNRILIPADFFIEWMHVQVVGKSGKLLKTPEKFPYLIQMKDEAQFYFLGVYNPWKIPDTEEIINTFALLTTEANSMMKIVHNSKERMPTVPPGSLNEAWLYNNLTPQDIADIANFQIASAEMKATPLDKDFLKKTNPFERVIYKEVPELIYN